MAGSLKKQSEKLTDKFLLMVYQRNSACIFKIKSNAETSFICIDVEMLFFFPVLRCDMPGATALTGLFYFLYHSW